MKKKNNRLLILLEIFLVIALGFGFFFAKRYMDQRDLALSTQEQRDRRFLPYITYQGQNYPLKRNMSTVLLIGTDNFADDEKKLLPDDYFHNNTLADFLVLLVFDHSAKTVTPLQIGRDTMCTVKRIDNDGKPLPDGIMQIALSHAYGSGKEDSCLNTLDSVETLLFHVPIDNYLAFTMDTVPLVNDLVGGVTVTLENDMPALGSEYVKGASITLKGKQALRFVRYRDTQFMNSNLRRMSNHRLYMDGFTVAARAAAEKDSELVVKGFKLVQRFLCTDLTLDHIQRMIDDLVAYEFLPFVTPGGAYDLREGEKFPGFYTDDASVWAVVKPTFCQ